MPRRRRARLRRRRTGSSRDPEGVPEGDNEGGETIAWEPEALMLATWVVVTAGEGSLSSLATTELSGFSFVVSLVLETNL